MIIYNNKKNLFGECIIFIIHTPRSILIYGSKSDRFFSCNKLAIH